VGALLHPGELVAALEQRAGWLRCERGWCCLSTRSGHPAMEPDDQPLPPVAPPTPGESKRLVVESPCGSLPANASGFDTHRASITSRFDCSAGATA
jgi:hypothetical protein